MTIVVPEVEDEEDDEVEAEPESGGPSMHRVSMKRKRVSFLIVLSFFATD